MPPGQLTRATLAFNKVVLSAAGSNVSEAAAGALEGAHFGIWTTTPWTIPANLAVAVNEALDYSVVEAQVGTQGGRELCGVGQGRAGRECCQALFHLERSCRLLSISSGAASCV
jgi:hypothetical protein